MNRNRKGYYFLYMLAPIFILLIILFTSKEVLNIFHFVQQVEGEGEEYKFAINKKELKKFQNILITSNQSSHFSGFNWIIKSKKVIQDYYLSFKGNKKQKDPEGVSEDRVNDFTISTGKDRIPGYFKVPFHLYGPGGPDQVLKDITLRIDDFGVPWHLLGLVFLCALMEIILLFVLARILKGKPVNLKPLVYTVTITNILLVFRLLFAYKAYLQYPFSAKSYNLAVYALFLVPLFLYLCFVLHSSGIFGKPGDLIKRVVQNNYSSQLLLLLLIFIIPVIFKVGVGIGREAITGGKRFALSIFFVPFLIMADAAALCFVFYWFPTLKERSRVNATFFNRIKVSVNDKLHSIISFFLVVALLGVYGFIGLKDKGFLLLYIPPFIMACAICFSLLNIKGRRRSKWRLLPVGLSYLGLAGILLFLLFPGKIILLGHNILSNLKFTSGVEAREIADSFELQRTLSSIDSPLILQDFSKDAWTQMEELDKVKQYLEYSKTHGGYFRVTIDKALGNRALHDYAAAAFLISEFGGFWVLVTLLLFFCFAFFPLRLRKKLTPEDKYNYSFLVFLMTGLTLFYSGLYMLGGNLFLFPFSGKNVYLWGLDSGSDVVEAALLLGIFVISYARSVKLKREDG